MKNKTQTVKREGNRMFLSQKNLLLQELLNQIDMPQETSVLQPTPTPKLIQPQPQPQLQQSDSLTLLLSRAHNAVSSQIQQSKPSKKSTKRLEQQIKKQSEAFLTGVQLANIQQQQKRQQPTQALDDEILYLLQKKGMHDDLQMLRRQINLTNKKLKSYQRNVMKTQKSVNNLAGRYNTYYNLKIPVSSPTINFSGCTINELKAYKKLVQKQY